MLLPRGLRAPDAALYVGLSQTKFLSLVDDERMPRPIKIDGCVVWDRIALDAAFDALDAQEEDLSWDD